MLPSVASLATSLTLGLASLGDASDTLRNEKGVEVDSRGGQGLSDDDATLYTGLTPGAVETR